MAMTWEKFREVFIRIHTRWRYDEVGSKEMCDDKRYEESLSSACELTFPFEFESSRGWAGNYPCVFGPTEGCSRHNPEKRPIAYNKRVPSDKKTSSIAIQSTGSPQKDKVERNRTQDSEGIWSLLHPDHSTVDPLDPVHKSFRYALAYYHIHWVQTAASPEVRRARLNALACRGIVVGNGLSRPSFRYWSSPYWYKDSFYLQQAVRFTIELKRPKAVFGREFTILGRSANWTFKTCPHQQQRFQLYEFRETQGLMKAGMAYVTKWRNPLGSTSRKWNKWQSLYGPDRHVSNCQSCCTDTCLEISLVKGKIVVHIWIWKDLGKGLGAFDPKWISALRPEASVWSRSRSEADSNRVRSAVCAAIRKESA
ncbi:hypothetical protein F5Y11DRAFT_350145 [Daldinia sp. FL1419]|nr:hypothetical protein F5Y11DRAFT_350145 [Daldinia sp. FL1419]